MRARRPTGTLIAAAATAALLVAGCGSGGSNTVTQTKTVTGPAGTGTSAAAPESGATAVAASLASATPANLTPDVAKIYEFLSPSKNIGCTVDPQEARCDIRQYTWKNPPKPASCMFDWGGTLNVTAGGPGRIGCVSDSAAGGHQILQYGTYLQVKRYRCTSEMTGMTCKNVITGDGFFVSRQRYRVF